MKRVATLLFAVIFAASFLLASCSKDDSNGQYLPSEDKPSREERMQTAGYFMDMYTNELFLDQDNMFASAVYSDSVPKEAVEYASLFFARKEVFTALQAVYSFESGAQAAFDVQIDGDGRYDFLDTANAGVVMRRITFYPDSSAMCVQQHGTEGALEWVFEAVKLNTGNGHAIQYSALSTDGAWAVWQLIKDNDGVRIGLKGPTETSGESIVNGIIPNDFAE